MNLAMLGQDGAARLALDRALRIDPAFAGNGAARERLAILSIDGETAGPSDRALLEKAVAKDPHDPAAASRLATLYERAGEPDKAIAVSEALLAQDPSDEPALARLARLYASRGETARALALAKSARALDPADTTAARVLASLACQSGDYPWAVSLLSEAAGRRPGDPEILFDLARAWFGAGRVPESAEAIRTVLALPGPFSRTAEATRLLDLIGLEDHASAGEVGRVAAALRADPVDVAALMAQGAIAQRAGDPAAARRAFAGALAADPHFLPAARRIVVLAAANPGDDGPALAAASAARDAYPDDPGLAKACGILMYRTGNYTGAAGLLEESAGRRSDDADLMYYLGMAQYRLRDKSSRATLQRALSLDPRSGLAAEARQALAASP
jgi:Flp pilus assembly protein TadD